MKALNYFPLLAIFLCIPGHSQSVGDYRSVQPPAPAFPVYDWKSNTSWEVLTALPNAWVTPANSPDNQKLDVNVNILSYVELREELRTQNDPILIRIGSGPVTTSNNPYKVSDYKILVIYGDVILDNEKPLLEVEENGILVIFGDLDMKNKGRVSNDGILVISGTLLFGNPSNKSEYSEGPNSLLFLDDGPANVTESPNDASEAAKTFEQLCGETPIDGIVRENDPRRDVLDALCDFISNGGAFPLPVELLAYEAIVAAPSVELTWSTATELNNDFFTLERSADGIQFEVIATVAGSGTTNETSHYKYTDESPLLGMAYYRLSQTDYDGTHAVLGVRAVTFMPSGTAFILYPNPLRGNRLVLQAAGLSNSAEATFRITDLSGRSIQEFSFQPGQEAIRRDLEITAPLPRGFYLAELQHSGRRFLQKLVVD